MEMTREESVAQHLRKHVGKTFCDDCIAKSIGINRLKPEMLLLVSGYQVISAVKMGFVQNAENQKK